MPSRGLGGKRRLILLVSVLLTAGFLATSLISYTVYTASVRQGIVESGLPLTSDNIYSEIQRDLLRPVLISSLMAQDTFLHDWVIDGEQDVGRIQKYLAEIKRKYDTVTSFFVSEQTHTYYYADGILKKVDKDSWRDAWYFRVREMQKPYEINVDPDMANKDAMTIFINYRMFDGTGAFIGATGVGLTVRSMREQIDDYRKRYGRRIYFADSTGQIMLTGSRVDVQPGQNIHGQPIPPATAAPALSQEKGSFRFERGDETVLLNTRFIPELGWTLFVEQDEAPATADIRRALLINLALCFAITLVVVAATAYTINIFQTQIEALAITDNLTGYLNRHGFEVVFDQALRESNRTKEPLSVILFDIDHFKKVNDRHSHLVGDAVIRHVAGVARDALRESDIFCRWGGEEFLVMLKNCDLDDAARLAARVCEQVHDTHAVHDGGDIQVTVSLGVAQHIADETAVHLVGRADKALYEAKNAGRDRVVKAV